MYPPGTTSEQLLISVFSGKIQDEVSISAIPPPGYLSVQCSRSTPLAHQILPRWNHSSCVEPGGLVKDQQIKVMKKAAAARNATLYDTAKKSYQSSYSIYLAG